MDDYKEIFKLAVVSCITILVLSFGKDQAARLVLQNKLSAALEAPVKLSNLSIGFWHHRIVAQGLRVYDPDGFPEEIILDIPQVTADYDFEALLKRKLVLYELHLNVRRLIVSEDTENQLNVNVLTRTLRTEKAAGIHFKVDNLYVTIGKVIYRPRALAGDKFQTFEVGIKEKNLKNVENLEILLKFILLEALKSTSIKGIAIYYDR